MSRQNFYKTRKVRKRREVDEKHIKKLVNRERVLHPRLGGLKVYNRISSDMKRSGIRIGRDKFFEVLRNQDLLVEPLPRKPRTTCSSHSLGVYDNKVKGMEISRPNQVWASDITYIRTLDDFLYLSLITDMYSRKIVGYNLGGNLESEETLKALGMALKEKPAKALPIHHSDRGSQYCCHEYVDLLKANNLGISMTEKNHCAENALAERVNGILKQEYYLGGEFRNMEDALKAVKQAVYLYNTCRPHRSLKMKTPAEVHGVAA